MSLYDKASLVQIPSGYKGGSPNGTLYSVLPANGDGDFDHTRASSATRVNKDGLIESVASGVPRLDYPLIDGVVQSCPALLLEPSRTNYLRYSEDLSQSNWVKTNTGTGIAPIVTDNYAISPDGSQNASRVQFDINGGTTISDRSRLYQDAGTGTSGNQAYSVYVKSNDTSTHAIVFRALGGAFNVKTVTTEWQRIDMAATDNSFYFELGLYGDSATSDTADILVWGAQMEEGSYPTSYIPTTSSTVTRSADVANNSGNADLINSTEGVLYAEISGFKDDPSNRYLSIHDGTNQNAVYIAIGGNDFLYVGVRSNNTTQYDRFYSRASGFICENSNKIAVHYKQNDFFVYLNGNKILEETSGSTPIGMDELAFNYGGSSRFYGNVKCVAVFKEALTDEELQQLTS